MKRRRFKQLTRADRLNIEKYLRQGMTKQAVADALGVSLRTVYYELKRGQYIHTNSDLTEEARYSCDVAESVKKYNGTNKGPQLKIGNDHELAAYIERRIVEDGYSPAAVLGEIRVKGMKFKTSICKSTLYSYIRKGVFLTLEMRDLPRHGKNKRGYTRTHKKGARASAGTSIEERPEEVNTRATIGHWEMDSVLGKKKTKPALLVLSERLSRKELIIKVQDHRRQRGSRPGPPGKEDGIAGLPRHLQVDNRRQWFRVCRRRRHGTKLSPEWAADEGLLLPPLFFLGARDQRKHERPDPPLVPEGDGLQQSQRPGNPEGRRLAERLSP